MKREKMGAASMTYPDARQLVHHEKLRSAPETSASIDIPARRLKHANDVLQCALTTTASVIFFTSLTLIQLLEEPPPR